MAKKGSKKRHGTGGMRYSQIPYAKRLQIRQMCDIKAVRDHSAKITMFCHSIALHELYGIGYKRLVRYSLKFKELIDEYYEDMDVGLYRARHRLESHGIPIPEEVPHVLSPGLSPREQQQYDHAIEASYVAHLVGLIADNEVFGFGGDKLEKLSVMGADLMDRYNKEGEGFLFEEMEKLGFTILDGHVTAFLDEDGEGIKYQKWLEGKEKNSWPEVDYEKNKRKG